MDRLFAKYPKIFYEGLECVDLTRRVKISAESRRNPNLFYPLTLNAGLRADSLADAYYSDPELDWLIWFSNDIIDTYYDWYLDEFEFNEFIRDKYGTTEFAIEKTFFWRNNWHPDDDEFSVSIFNNNIANDAKQYYAANFDAKGDVLSYSRKKEDWNVATNKILQYAVTYTVGNSYSNGEILDIKSGAEIVGGAEVVVSNSSAVIINHTSGNTHANTIVTKTLIGETSNTEATTTSVTTLQEVITNTDARFWTRVSYFDWEDERNQQKKHLKIMDNTFKLEASEQFRLQLKEE